MFATDFFGHLWRIFWYDPWCAGVWLAGVPVTANTSNYILVPQIIRSTRLILYILSYFCKVYIKEGSSEHVAHLRTETGERLDADVLYIFSLHILSCHLNHSQKYGPFGRFISDDIFNM